MNRPPLRLISIAWGESYVDTFLELCLPALLAPGNLPALVDHYSVELVLVTESRYFKKVRLHPAVLRAASICKCTTKPLDDLVATRGSYGMSLTYAFFRGFQDLGPAMTDCYLVFIHADFILADGSYRRLLPYLQQNRRLVLSPSYCTIAEDVRPHLERRRHPDGTILAVAPRAMADLIIRNRHFTMRAKTVNQRFFRLSYVDQFYWLADESTILAHQLPIAVVAMKPERYLEDVTAYWDYGVIAEFCPSMKYAVLGDSDEFLMMELRERDTAKSDLTLGWPTAAMIAAKLATYMTDYKRDIGREKLTLHSRELPAGIEVARAGLDRFLESVYARLPEKLVPHLGHPQWTYHYKPFHSARAAYLARLSLDGLGSAEPVRHEQMDVTVHLADAEIHRGFKRVQAEIQHSLIGAAADLLPSQVDALLGSVNTLAKIMDEMLAHVEARAVLMRRTFHVLGRARQVGHSNDSALSQAPQPDSAASRERIAEIHGLALAVAHSGQALKSTITAAQADIASAPMPALDELLAGIGQACSVMTGVSQPSRPASSFRTQGNGIARRFWRAAFGQPPDHRPWHWARVLARLAVASVARHKDRRRRILLLRYSGLFDFLSAIHDSVVPIHYLVSGLPGVLHAVLADHEPFDHLVIESDLWGLRNLRRIYDEVRPRLKPGATVTALYINYGLDKIAVDDIELIRSAFPVCGPTRIAYCGSWFSAAALRVRVALTGYLLHGLKVPAHGAAALATVCAAPFALIGFLIERDRTLENSFTLPRVVTSITVEIDIG